MTGEKLKAICDAKLEYLFLASLISSDNILTIEDAKKSLADIGETEKLLKDADISQEKKDEITSFLNKGKDILNQDIEEFMKKNAE